MDQLRIIQLRSPLASNVIDISLSSEKSSTYVILDSATTDLITITGAQFSGQDLILQGKTGSTITVKNSGNIVTSDGADYDIVGLALVRLIYDEASTKWRIYSTVGSGGGGGSTWVGTAASQLNMGAFSIVGAWGGTATTLGIESDIDMNNFDIEDVNALKINSGGAGTADSFTMFGTSSAGAINLVDDTDTFNIQVDGTSRLTISDSLITSSVPISATGIQDVGHVYLDGAGTNDLLIDGTADGLEYKVPTGDEHTFKINNVERMVIKSTHTNIENYIDIRTPTTTPPTNTAYTGIIGWFKIKVAGGDYRMPVWAAP